jgi:hypothetical protein
MKKLTRGEHKHKEIFFYHAHDYGKKGSSFVKNVDSYYQYCQVTGHHTSECPLPNILLPTIPRNSTMYKYNHFLLSKVKRQIKAKFIGKLTKNDRKKLPKYLWVFKALVTYVQGPKLGWVPKTKV